jgi:hypothetical protein
MAPPAPLRVLFILLGLAATPSTASNATTVFCTGTAAEDDALLGEDIEIQSEASDGIEIDMDGSMEASLMDDVEIVDDEDDMSDGGNNSSFRMQSGQVVRSLGTNIFDALQADDDAHDPLERSSREEMHVPSEVYSDSFASEHASSASIKQAAAVAIAAEAAAVASQGSEEYVNKPASREPSGEWNQPQAVAETKSQEELVSMQKAMFRAVMQQDVESIDRLIGEGVDMEARNGADETPLEMAQRKNRAAIVALLA